MPSFRKMARTTRESRINTSYTCQILLYQRFFVASHSFRIFHEGVVGELTVGNAKGVDQHGPQFVKASWSAFATVQQLSVERVERRRLVLDPKPFLNVAPGRSRPLLQRGG